MTDAQNPLKTLSPLQQDKNLTLREHILLVMQRYFSSLGEIEPRNLYNLVMEEVEEPLFRAVMKFTSNNQSETSRVLGLARGTVRKKLKQFGLIDPNAPEDDE